MNLRFTSLTLRNFLSYGNNITVIQLDRQGSTTAIVGEDLDNTSNGQGANGVGKSALVNALAYGCYGKPVSQIGLDKLVNNINKKNMEVTVEFIAHDGNQYRIHRNRKTKAGAAGNNVYFYKNGEDVTLDSADRTNKEIERIIGVPYELFVRIVLFSAGHTPFLDLPQKSHYATNQTDIIEELFGLTAISAKAALLKDFIKDNEAGLKIKQVKVEQLEKEHIRHEQQVTTAKRRVETWKEQNETTISNLRNKLKRLDTVDIDQQRMLHDQLKDVESQLNDVLERQRSNERQVKDLLKQYNKNEADLKHLRDDKCPYCLQEFAEAKVKIKEGSTLSDQLYEKVEAINAELTLITADVSKYSTTYKQIKDRITVDNLDELINIKNESENIRHKIAEFECALNPYIEPLQELLDIKLEPINYEDINKVTREVEHQKFLLKLLTKNDSFVRKALLNKNIPYLNGRLQYYLTALGLPHQVEFTHEMTANISQFGRELDFGNLSNGQRARVNLALSFAFKDVLQRLHTKINVCILDEVLDIGLDAVGVQAAARLLKRKARDEQLSMYIISHRDEIDGIFDAKMVVQMSKGFSYVKEEQI